MVLYHPLSTIPLVFLAVILSVYNGLHPRATSNLLQKQDLVERVCSKQKSVVALIMILSC